MNKNDDSPESADLRRRAEERVKEHHGRLSPMDAERLVHELEVHQIELEMQNEELRTARRDLEAALARYTALFDFAPIGYVTLTAEGVIQAANHAATAMLRGVRGRVLGRRFADFVADADQVLFNTMLQQAYYGGGRERIEVELAPAAKAARLHVRITAAVVEPAGAMALLAFEDISDRRAREERLARTEQALRDGDRRKDEFLAALSHELRNPLAPIRTSLHVLGRVAPGSEQAARAKAIIDRQVTHLTHLVDDLLDVTRITRGKIQLQRDRVELNELVRRTIEDHRASFDASGVHLEADLAPQPLFVHADSVRLVQILSNLLGNAEKFTPAGGRVALRLRRLNDTAFLRVSDTGTGIAPEVLQHLFEPFAQGPQTMDRSRGGLGLGLATVRGLVELHGGRVGITSEGPGRGTEVLVTLPLGTAAEGPAAPAVSVSARGRRVLLIEDNVDAAESMKEALTLAGHEVETAFHGSGGLERARAFRPEIVLCDIGLPGMDGYAVARAFRADPALAGTYLVALSGYTRAEDLHASADAGFDRHIGKPIDPALLDRVIAEASSARARG